MFPDFDFVCMTFKEWALDQSSAKSASHASQYDVNQWFPTWGTHTSGVT